jgi:hypothetical protein
LKLRWFILAAVLLAGVPGWAQAPRGDRREDRVLVLANSDDPDSLRIARHYAEARGVPAANLIALKLPLAESITWREFVATLWQPLLDRLVATGWVDAIPMATTDAVGRVKYAPHRHRIATRRSRRKRSPSRIAPSFAPTPGRWMPNSACWRCPITQSTRLCRIRCFRMSGRPRMICGRW